jgi:RNA polymerase sigma factor (sigma-70 family)
MLNLKKIKDDVLIENVKIKNCSESLNELVDRHSGMCFTIGKKYATSCGLDIHDINDNRHWIIYNALSSYDSNKGSKFSTWLGNQIRFFCLNFKNKNNKLVATDDKVLEFFINENNQANRTNQKETVDIIVDLFNQISDLNTKNAIYYRYFYNKDRILNYSEIADILKVTPQTVLNWHNKFIKFAKKKLTNAKISDSI